MHTYQAHLETPLEPDIPFIPLHYVVPKASCPSTCSNTIQFPNTLHVMGPALTYDITAYYTLNHTHNTPCL